MVEVKTGKVKTLDLLHSSHPLISPTVEKFISPAVSDDDATVGLFKKARM
jgi:hypothetical protein